MWHVESRGMRVEQSATGRRKRFRDMQATDFPYLPPRSSTCLREGFRRVVRGLVVSAPAVLLWVPLLEAQSLSGSGATWGGSWQFQSPSARSVNIQQADTIKRAESGFYSSFGPAQTIVNNKTINDNRSNYVETTSGEGGLVEIVNRVGDEIGKVSNVTGAINTGSTEIRVDGNSNTVTAINSSDSHGCLDGSINVSRMRNQYADPTSAASVLNAAAGFNASIDTATSMATGGSQSGCVTR